MFLGESLWLFFVLRWCYGQGASRTPVLGFDGTRCYDDFNRPQRCIPEFENAAFDVGMEATNTCGENGMSEYCVQTGILGVRKNCEVCRPNQHDARFMTDFHNQDHPTWWQSETMLEGVQWPNQVNLTLKFGKSFDVTYVRIWFWSPRPESFYISKRTTENSPWIPYQYYSGTCRDTYGLPDTVSTIRGEETRALCTSEYADMSPLRGGNVAFGTLEGRPSAYNFDGSPELQDWVTATEIMITLDRINTFGDELFGDHRVLRSYFYAVADVAVGARCKCNGHASECVATLDAEGRRGRSCRCEHNTVGEDCRRCLPFYNDVPWRRATATDANECKECNCNGYSNRCYFDETLYEQTGHGGHCLDCSANRDGPNCERCKDHHYSRDDGYCTACDCNPTGSVQPQCNAQGACQCKPGVAGVKCDRCEENFFDFSTFGCKPCGCQEAGSLSNVAGCDPYSGSCYCKDNVEGKQCRECKPGYFNLDPDNEFGCTPCFCYGHSSSCHSTPGFSKYSIESSFSRNDERWSAEDGHGLPTDLKYDSFTQSVGVRSDENGLVYFVAPAKFLGDQMFSYNQLLEFTVRIGNNRAVASPADVVLQGGGITVTNTIFSQQNRVPSLQNQKFSFRLHEHPDYGWRPKLSVRSFFSVLTNLTAIKIKGIYSDRGQGFLDEVRLGTAARGVAGEPARWIEACDCPTGYIGQFCESCAPGFRHSPALGGSFASCIPCECNNHASICEFDSGKCICQHDTVGENCELCARGFYGNALAGTSADCQPCGCPDGGACIQIDEDTVVCTECPTGYTGAKCDSCADGYFGDPEGSFASPAPCRQCSCNKNIDANAIGNCDTNTGECLRCIYNTDGPKCDVCLPGYYGNALVLPKGDCKICSCFAPGTEESPAGYPICDPATGSCNCKSHVVGQNCDRCEDGYFDLHAGEGCQTCNCDIVGSTNRSCDVHTGQCYCRPGISGARCDHCESHKFGFSLEGCVDCDCDPTGSVDLQCDASGQCPCLTNVEGQRCDRCKENKFDRQKGCIDCPDCYALVQNEARNHDEKLTRLGKILDDIDSKPTVVPDEDFPNELGKVREEVRGLFSDVVASTRDNGVIEQVEDVENRKREVLRVLATVDERLLVIDDKNVLAGRNIERGDNLVEELIEKLVDMKNDVSSVGKETLEKALKQSELVGQHSQKMTVLAQEARDIADSLDSKADECIVLAKKTKNESIVAYYIAETAVHRQSQLAESLRKLKNDVQSAETQLSKSKDWTREVGEKTGVVKKNALALLSEVENLRIPEIDMLQLAERSELLRNEMFVLSNRTDDLFRDSSDMRIRIDEQTELGEGLLRDAESQQEVVNDLRNDLVFCGSQASVAVNLWEEIYNGALTNYKLLKEFDTQTEKNKDEAAAALDTINDIETVIEAISRRSATARTSLDEAKRNSDLAFDKAEQANELARNASSNAELTKSEAETLFKNTTALGEEAGLMYDRVQNTEGELKNLLGKFRSNASLVDDAKEKVGRAGKDTDTVSRKISDLLRDVEGIMLELHASPTIEESDVDRLEEEIKLAEDRMKETRLEEKLVGLRDEHQVRGELIGRYKMQIAVLQEEVDNIEDIIDNLPDGCYRRVELEP